MSAGWGRFIETLLSRIIPIIIGVILGVGVMVSQLLNRTLLASIPIYLRAGFTLLTNLLIVLLTAFTVVSMVGLAWIKDARDIMMETRDILDERLPHNPGSNPGRKRKRRVKVETSGGGALIGLIIGGLLGLPYGSGAVALLGFIGAIIGDILERESRKRRT